jgi:serine/threonine protein kinase
VRWDGDVCWLLNPRLRGQTALTSPHQVFFPDTDAKESYEQEVAALELVTRKAPPEARVVRLVEAFEEGGVFYTVMTPLCRKPFDRVIDNYAIEPYSLEQALTWGVELAQAVHTLHSTCRLFHGDISARNVLLGQDGHVYLADLGLAEHNHPYGMKMRRFLRLTGGEAPEMKEGDRGYDSTAEVREGRGGSDNTQGSRLV